MAADRRVVDVHSHHFPRALVHALERRDELPFITEADGRTLIHYGKGNVHPLEPPMTNLELRMHDMDAQGIELAVLSVNVPGVDWFSPADGLAIAREVNDELAAVVASHHDRLAWMAALPLQAPDAAASELERAAGLGARGAMIYSNVAGHPLDEARFEVVWEAAARLDLPVLIHPTYPLVASALDAYALIPTLGFLVDTSTATLRLVLGGLYERHPDFKLVVAHAGSLIPQLVGRIDYEAARAPNGRGALEVPPSERLRLLYTDCVCVWAPALASTLAFLGPERVMFGSDYPFWDPDRGRATLSEAGLDDERRRLIDEGNARGLFRLPAGKPSASAGQPR